MSRFVLIFFAIFAIISLSNASEANHQNYVRTVKKSTTASSSSSAFTPAYPFTASACLLTPIPSPSTIFHCGSYGRLSKPAPPTVYTSVTSNIACAEICQANQTCISFGYAKTTLQCTLWGLPLTSMGLIQKTSGTIRFSNRHCFNCTSKSTTVKASIQSTSMTSTSTSSTTTTTYATSTSASPTPTPIQGCPNVASSCGATGFDALYYFNDFGTYSNTDCPVYSNYYVVDGLIPLDFSSANVTYADTNEYPPNRNQPIFPNSTQPDLQYYPDYTRKVSGMVVDANNFTVVYTGLFQAPVTGDYYFCTVADNENDIYLGDGYAFDCQTGAPGPQLNPFVQGFGANGINNQQCAYLSLVQGVYYPLRIVFGNFQGISGFDFTMTLPDAESSSDDFSGMAYPMNCVEVVG